MTTILKTLRYGPNKERLAVIADLMSVIGVSGTTVIGGGLAFYATNQKINVNNLVGVAIFSLIGLAVLCCLIAGFILVVALMSKPWKTPPFFKLLIKSAICIVYLCLVLLAVIFFYEFISGFRILV
ncbi:hypothetical protein [Citrobacter freundii]|uniref:hypothetical protein n=1 Tax=Citrobacter freundii TaxID=546 RepID=UPI0028BE44A7|nr:hypothetical protein [Citrobacter freundii]MDT7309074.1 hypothetical protein [Citrobacter freundii]